MRVIGLSGKAGSGKDYITQYVLAPLGYRPFSLSWHFKIWLAARGEATTEEVFVTKPRVVRELLQQTGTELGRNVYGADIWCNVAAEWMRLFEREWKHSLFVVPDVRFENEVAMIHGLGGKVLRLHAPQRVAASPLSAEARLHASEISLDDYAGFDGYVENDAVGTTAARRQLMQQLETWGWVGYQTVDRWRAAAGL